MQDANESDNTVIWAVLKADGIALLNAICGIDIIW